MILLPNTKCRKDRIQQVFTGDAAQFTHKYCRHSWPI